MPARRPLRGVFIALAAAGCAAAAGPERRLENAALGIAVDGRGRLLAIDNRLTGETYRVQDAGLAVQGIDVAADDGGADILAQATEPGHLAFRGRSGPVTFSIEWTLRTGAHFAEKAVTLACDRDCDVRTVGLGTLTGPAGGPELVAYGHPDLDWVVDYVQAKHGGNLRRPAGSQPSTTFFGRTPRGGFFAGVEMAYDASRLTDGSITFAFAPHARIRAGEPFVCPRVYVGVTARSPDDARAAEWGPVPAAVVVNRARGGFDGAAAAGLPKAAAVVGTKKPAAAAALPLPSESRAMVAMTSRLLGPPRHGVMALACGWHCQMTQDEYASDAELEKDMRALDFFADCGLDGLSDSHPWSGDARRIAALRAGQRYELDGRARRFLERARELDLVVVQWPTMNNSHPWQAHGVPLRLDRPEWLRGIDGEPQRTQDITDFRRRDANCLACRPFADWLSGIVLDDALGTGLYRGLCMDGDFWGTGGYVNTTLPVTCLAADHDHLPGDANDACQRRLDRLVAEVRRRYPGMYILMCRPPMDLGVWAQRNVDACFTLIESGTDLDNVAAGDEIRTAARIRVHLHFFPHWLDQALLFPSRAVANPPPWSEADVDYAMLSGLSSGPNLLLYLPARSGLPKTSRAEIRRWLEWGRANEKFLMVRRDLFDWPLKGKVDGSAHVVGHEGLVFLFNGTRAEGAAEVPLDESIGLDDAPGRRFTVAQEHPHPGPTVTATAGETVAWRVPGRTAVVLRIRPATP